MADASEPSRPAQSATSSTSSSHDLEVWYEFVSDKQSAVAVTLRELLQRDPSDTASTMVYRRGHSEEWQPLGEALSSRSSVQSRPQFSQRESGELPANFQRGVNVTVDPTTGGLVGLPESWAGVVPDGCAPGVQSEAALPAHLKPKAAGGVKLTDSAIVGAPFNVKKWKPAFGIPIEGCDCVTINGFEIPVVLEALWEALRARGGLTEEGIFRIQPDQEACADLKAALNADPAATGGCADAHAFANLIKVWFRELPEKLLSAVSMAEILECETGADCMAVLQRFDRKNLGLVLWLLDVCADVAAEQASNKMSERAIAIVLAPNLYAPPEADDDNPLEGLLRTQKMTKFLSELLFHYISVRHRVRGGGASQAEMEVSGGRAFEEGPAAAASES